MRALPLLEWTARERARAIAILRRDVEHPQKFVRVWALDSLATFAKNDRALTRLVLRDIDRLDRSGGKALKARVRRIRERLTR